MCGARYVRNTHIHTHTHATAVQGRTFLEPGLCPTMSCPGPTLSLGLMGRDHCRLRMCLLAALSVLSVLAVRWVLQVCQGQGSPTGAPLRAPLEHSASTDLAVLEHLGLTGLGSETPGCDTDRATYPSKRFLQRRVQGALHFFRAQPSCLKSYFHLGRVQSWQSVLPSNLSTRHSGSWKQPGRNF